MKKYLIILFITLLNVLNVNAQTYYYRTTGFAIKYKTVQGWGNWSDWQSSNMKVKIDLDDDIVVIYSDKLQVYRVIEDLGSYTDESGGRQQKFRVIDQDDDYGTLRLRIEKNGNSQIYIDFADVGWVYNVVRI